MPSTRGSNSEMPRSADRRVARSGSLLAVVVLVVFSAAAHAQTVVYVDDDATGANDGSSWCDAYDELNDALAVANSGDTIKVADGQYSPDETGLMDPRDATFQLENGVTVLGGYAGCGAGNPDERDVQQYESKLTGDLWGDDAQGTTSDPSTCASYVGSWSDDVCDSVDANGTARRRRASARASVAVQRSPYSA